MNDQIPFKERSVPLIGTASKVVFDEERMALGTWMAVAETYPIRPVRVFVTVQALTSLDPLEVPDREGAFKIFERERASILSLASRKYDESRTEEDLHEGCPVVLLCSDDFS